MSEENQTNNGQTRRVTFAENLMTQTFEWDETDIKEAWYENDFGTTSKDNCSRAGRGWQKHGYDVLIHEAFGATEDSDIQDRLNRFVMLGEKSTPRGIERLISSPHAEERKYSKNQCIETVVDLCTYLKRHGKTLAEIEEELYNLSTEHSKSARTFAERMGLADECAVRAERLAEERERLAEEEKRLAQEEVQALAKEVQAMAEEKAKSSKKGIISYSGMNKRIARMMNGQNLTTWQTKAPKAKA